MASTIVAVVEDLFFLAKIQETAKALGVKVVTVDPRGGLATIAELRPQAIILDLNPHRWDPVECVQTLKADLLTRSIPIVGFVSHVQEQIISAARAAGCDTVMARSAFVRQLPTLLGSFRNT